MAATRDVMLELKSYFREMVMRVTETTRAMKISINMRRSGINYRKRTKRSHCDWATMQTLMHIYRKQNCNRKRIGMENESR